MDEELCKELGSFCKNPNNGGCDRRCPCNLWINCSYYTDEHTKQQRLRQKQYNKEIVDWYTDNFREETKMSDVTTNG